MKINKLKINNYGKLKDIEIKLNDNINIIYGQNEAGKSTLLNFILNSFYGISKNKKGKDISDYDKYKPWVGEEFSGKVEYELDNGKKYEVYRDFNKKNPKILDEEKQDISKQFNIDKSKGNEFFFEQTKIDEELFVSTIMVGQQEVKLQKSDQNVLIQKIANLVGTGEDNVSFKRALDRLNRRQLSEVGTGRSREKPINIIEQNINELEKEKEELEKFQNLKYEIEENKNNLNDEILEIENENNFLQEIKILNENEKIENEKINLKINLKNENNEKINLIKNKINEINLNNKNIFEKNKKIKNKKNKLNKNIIIIFLLVILINISQFILTKNKLFNYIFLITVPTVLIFYLFLKKKINNEEKNIKNKLEKINIEINNLNNEINILEKNNENLEEEINKLKNNFNLKINLEKEKIKNNYLNKIEKNKINNLINLENINLEKENVQNLYNEKKLQLHSLELDYKNIEPKLENLSNIEEQLVNNKDKKVNLKDLEKSINLAKEVLIESYDEMKSAVTPRFTQNLSQIIKEITNGKYTNVIYQDETGLMVELESGDYVPADRLSIGTIDQLYLSLRISMLEELSEENMPIILDESFAYYDEKRLKNILKYMHEKFSEHQIIIFTCTDREENILKSLSIEFNMIEI